MARDEGYTYLPRENYRGARVEDFAIDLESAEIAARGILKVIGGVRSEHGPLVAGVYLDGFLQVLNTLLEYVDGGGRDGFQGSRIFPKDDFKGITEAGAGLAMDLIVAMITTKRTEDDNRVAADLRKISAAVLLGKKK